MVIAQNIVGSLEEDTYHDEVSSSLTRGDPAPDVVEHSIEELGQSGKIVVSQIAIFTSSS